MNRFENKVAIVTGGDGGIGSAIAARLASEGATVVFSGVNLQAALDVAKQIEGSGGKAIAITADISSGGASQKDHTRRTVHPADSLFFTQHRGQRLGRTDQHRRPQQPKQYVNPQKAECPGNQWLTLRNELGQERNVENPHFRIQYVPHHPLHEPV